MAGSVIVGGARTPIGKFNGGLASMTGAQLGGVAIEAALERSGVGAGDVDYVVMGQVLQAGQGQITARQGCDRRRDLHGGAGHHDQQGVPVGPERPVHGRPDDLGR